MAIKRLITLSTICAEKIDRSRSWIINEMSAGRFPQPAVKGNPNLWDEADVERWLNHFVATRGSHQNPFAEGAAKARAARRRIHQTAAAESDPAPRRRKRPSSKGMTNAA